MKTAKQRSLIALACVAGLGLAGQASALTVTKDLPTIWIPNGIVGVGGTLSIYDLPGGGRQLFFAYFANDDAGNTTWVISNTTTQTGQNSFTGLDMITNTGGTFNPGANVPGTAVGSADYVFNSCNELEVTYTFTGGSAQTVTYTPLIPSPTCVWQDEFAASACPAFSTGTDAEIPGSCVLPATLATSATLTNDHHWIISTDGFRFGNDLGPLGGTTQVLTIEPGTVIVGDNLPDGSQDLGAFFSISRGNQIQAVGTAEAPIVFTSKSHLTDGNLLSGQWGGVVIAGRSIPNDCDPNGGCLDEIQLNNYGGSDPTDSSGRLSYVRIEYAGTEVSALSELNGLSLYTTGTGTVIDHLHVHRNGDDGIEWFGASSNIKYALITDVDDDSFDWTSGSQFKVQYGISRMTEAAVKDARGFEGDGLEDNESAEPRSMPQMANITVYYEAGVVEGPQQALRLRRGTLGNFSNLLITSASGALAPSDCLRIDGPQTNIDAGTPGNLTGEFTMTNTVLGCLGGNLFDDNEAELLESEFFNAQMGNTTTPATFSNFLDGGNIGSSNVPLIPDAGSSADGIGAPPLEVFDDFFDKVDYAGGVEPGATSDWTAGEWTNVDPDPNL